MAYKKKTWKNRQSEYPNRRRLTDEDGNSQLVTVAREEGSITEEGDAFNAENMNDLEARVSEAIATERARIDNLTKMEEGSTTGDAELADIRVGYGGETYESAGSAVREQCRELYNQLTELKTYITDDLLGGAS